MTHYVAIDWDSRELRAVMGRSAGSGCVVTDAAIIPLDDESAVALTAALRKLIDDRGLAKLKPKLLVAIGRGKTELRQLTLPPVPANELPTMVRLMALQSFSAAGESAVVDFLPVKPVATPLQGSASQAEPQSQSVIAAAVTPQAMEKIDEIAEGTGMALKRVALRPIAAAALFQLFADVSTRTDGDHVLVDLLADDADIVVLRGGSVFFVRSVRISGTSVSRTAQIAGELRRSLMACGIDAAASPPRVVIWGCATTHQGEVDELAGLLGCQVTTLDPLALVTTESKRGQKSGLADSLDSHTGRLAPLIGLMATDALSEQNAAAADHLVDFLNPRKAVEIRKDYRIPILVGGVAAAAIGLLAFSAWTSLRNLDADIRTRQADLAALRPLVDAAELSIDRTERVDQFLDGNVNWLDEFKLLAEQMPPAEGAMLRSLSVATVPREGGGRVTLSGVAASPEVVDQLELALRESDRSITGSGANDMGRDEAYRWGFRETVTIGGDVVRSDRYRLLQAVDTEPSVESPDLEPPGAEPIGAEPIGAEPTGSEPLTDPGSEPLTDPGSESVSENLPSRQEVAQ